MHQILSYIRRGMDATSRLDQIFYLVPPLLFIAGPLLIPRFVPDGAEAAGMVGLVARHGPLIGAGMYVAWLVIMYAKGRHAASSEER
jgi:hypothetical protein